jgi:hypothetical protein
LGKYLDSRKPTARTNSNTGLKEGSLKEEIGLDLTLEVPEFEKGKVRKASIESLGKNTFRKPSTCTHLNGILEHCYYCCDCEECVSIRGMLISEGYK